MVYKYRRFCTIPIYSEEDNVYYGLLLDEDGAMLSDLVIWESDDLERAEKRFHEMVDSYLEFLDGNRKDEVENV